MSGMTKCIYLESQRCLRRGWYARNQPDDDLCEADLFAIDEGIEVGKRADQLYPGGVLVKWAGRLGTVNTQRLMNDPSVPAIFGATFHIDGYNTTWADILVRNGNGWRVVEVKSSLFNPEIDDQLIDDVCYTVMVATRCGVNVNAASLLQLRREYRRGDGVEKMFGETDVTTAVQNRMSLFSVRWTEIRDATAQSEPPIATPGSVCADCPYYAEHCLGKGLWPWSSSMRHWGSYVGAEVLSPTKPVWKAYRLRAFSVGSLNN